MAPPNWMYFDCSYTVKPLRSVYEFEPIPVQLSAEQAKHVLGAEAEMWTDSHLSEKQIDADVYPRALALAEVVWSPAAKRNFESFLGRLKLHLQRLDSLGVQNHPLD